MRLLDKRQIEYSPLIEKFLQEIKDVNPNGIPEPHLPVIGENYFSSKTKIAFCGMETYGWGWLKDFIARSCDESCTISDYTINKLEFLKWPANYHATFWGFVLKFLSVFYKADFNGLLKGDNPELLKSFLWANSNSIERYEVTAKDNGASIEDWEKVKKASRKFDNLNHIINAASPDVVILLYSGVDNKYFLDEKGISDIFGENFYDKENYLYLVPNKELKYRYYYRRTTGTHIFCLPHPTYMGLYSGIGIDAYVSSVIKDIDTFNIRKSSAYIEESGTLYEKSSIEYKRAFVAKLAKFLVDNNVVMSGQELQELFNRNKIRTQYGTKYSTEGGRGIHRVVSNIWSYYYHKGDYQTAYNISRAFVDKYNRYAYE